MDSIDWIIQGDAVCGAAFFDGENLLLATNKSDQEQIKLIQLIKKYLKTIACKAAEIAKEVREYEKNKPYEQVNLQPSTESIERIEVSLTSLENLTDENLENHEKLLFQKITQICTLIKDIEFKELLKAFEEVNLYNNDNHNGQIFKNSVNRAIIKLTNSILITYLDPTNLNVLPEKLVDAMWEDKMIFLKE